MNAPVLPVRFMLTGAAAAVSLATVMLVLAAVMRIRNAARARRRERTLHVWRERFLAAMYGDEVTFPRPPRADHEAVLLTWIRLFTGVDGVSRDQLVDAAERAGLHAAALDALRKRRRRDRVMATVACGCFRLRDAWPYLERSLHGGVPGLAAASAQALLRIDAPAAAPIVVRAVLDHPDWHPSRVASILADGGRAVTDLIASRVADTATPGDATRLVRLLGELDRIAALPVVRSTLIASRDDELTAACVRVLGDGGDPRDAWLARRLLEHPTPFVRVQATAALGKLGVAGDDVRLARMLADREWWVRYRAAQGLVTLPFVPRARLEREAGDHPDRYARDALSQALAEKGAS